MPPRIAPRGSGGGGGRGGRGGGPRGGGPPPGFGGPGPQIASHVTTVGIPRPAYGSSGRPTVVQTNHFECNTPDGTIYHYDVVISPSEKVLPARLNMDIITALQDSYPQVFTPPAVYDGRKNLFAPRKLPMPGDVGEFDVQLTDNRTADAAQGRGPKVYKIKLKKVAEVNTVVLKRFLEGKQSHDNDVLTAITALNVVIRMEPTKKYPFNVRSFFTDRETKDIGGGLILWRGYFQSIRPAVGRMLINVDISTGTMYKPGPLIDLCLYFLGGDHPRKLEKGTLLERDRYKLQRFLQGVRITTTHGQQGGNINRTPRVIKRLVAEGARDLSFEMRDHGRMTVAAYFQNTYHRPLKFPSLPCVEVGNGALLPIELCMVIPGQIMRKQIPPDKTKDVLEFATKKPADRLQSIRNGLGVLQYGQSPYVRQFGLHVATDKAVGVQARILEPPTLLYGRPSRQPTIKPNNGSWNMVDKKFYRPATCKGWMVVIFERQNRFNQGQADDMIMGLSKAAEDVGITGITGRGPGAPYVQYLNGQGNIAQQLRGAGAEHLKQKASHPGLIVAVMPEGSADIYHAVKHFGDIMTGVATQCLKSAKCFRAKPQYYANVCLKINVKLGGINTVPEPSSVKVLSDPANPTIVMGADVIHPAPGSDGRPSFTSVVGNVDSDNAKYIATTRVQASRQEQIEDIGEMTHHILQMSMRYRAGVEKAANSKPKRIIFYRDGVSEGQFKMVLENEVPQIKLACRKLQIDAKLTVIVVGKRHHVRLFPTGERDADRSGNCMAGTVVDREITHPTEFDFYLQSHGGLLGTSRPAHYSVLMDENRFTPDQLQSLSFTLCHVYARSTRSVSIPAPVYYADIVCSRAKNHYDPAGSLELSGSETQVDSVQAANTLEEFRKGFKNLHANTAINMYFS